MNTYQVTMYDKSVKTIQAENVYCEACGNIKLLNGKGKDAVLVAFYPVSSILSVEKVDAA